MAQRLRDKMSMAIDNIDPMLVKPAEIGSLMRVASELERKARVDEIAQDEMRLDMVRGAEGNPDLKNSPTKTSDMAEVLSILMSSGALGSATQVGVRETVTREIVAKNEEE